MEATEREPNMRLTYVTSLLFVAISAIAGEVAGLVVFGFPVLILTEFSGLPGIRLAI